MYRPERRHVGHCTPPRTGEGPGERSPSGDGRRDAADAKLFNKKMGLGRSEAGYDRRMDLNKDGTINYADFIILTGYIERDASSQSGQ